MDQGHRGSVENLSEADVVPVDAAEKQVALEIQDAEVAPVCMTSMLSVRQKKEKAPGKGPVSPVFTALA